MMYTATPYFPAIVSLAISCHNSSVSSFALLSRPHLPLVRSTPSRLRSSIQGDLTGDVLADKYVLSDDYSQSTSGKSYIYKAYHQDQNGEPTGKPVIIKISANNDALERETENYDKITSNAPAGNDLFVEILDYLPDTEANSEKFDEQGALVMERGTQDLKSFVEENGPMTGQQLQDAAETTAKAVKAVHDSDMVWTEVKSENFVVKEEGDVVKGIDLESAVPHMDNPVDFTPEACPPEFALAFLCGREPEMEMNYCFDVWSLGMLLYELATGKHYFEGEDCNVQIATTLKNMEAINMEGLNINADLKDLIGRCLQVDPQNRPSLDEVLQHEYFQK